MWNVDSIKTSLDFDDNQELWNIPSTLSGGVDTRQSWRETSKPQSTVKLYCTVRDMCRTARVREIPTICNMQYTVYSLPSVQ